MIRESQPNIGAELAMNSNRLSDLIDFAMQKVQALYTEKKAGNPEAVNLHQQDIINLATEHALKENKISVDNNISEQILYFGALQTELKQRVPALFHKHHKHTPSDTDIYEGNITTKTVENLNLPLPEPPKKDIPEPIEDKLPEMPLHFRPYTENDPKE